MPFISRPDGDVKKVFITDAWLLDQFVGSTLWSWGRNYQGGLGDNSVTSRSSPVQTVSAGTNWKEIHLGSYHSLSIKTDNALWVWGYNNHGQLGTNNVTNYSSPVTTAISGTFWKTCAAGYYHSAAIKTDGTLWMWGYNADGELGDNTVTKRSSGVQTVAAGTNWNKISCGGYHTACIKTEGTLWLWGYNNQGQLGDNTRTHRSSPVQTVAGGTNWLNVSCGGFSTAAIKTDGTLWTWGGNSFGGLGDNTIVDKSSPIQTITGGTSWKQVSMGGGNHTGAIKNDGSLWMWGYNLTGSLGDNTITNRSSPVQTVSAGTSWKQVDCGGFGQSTGAIKSDGSLWCWGRNVIFGTSTITGQIGTNAALQFYSSPIQTVAAGTTWKQVSVGYNRTAAVKNG